MSLEINCKYVFKVLKEISNPEKDFSIIEDSSGKTHYYPKHIQDDNISLYVSEYKNGKYFFSKERQIKTPNETFESKKTYPFKFHYVTKYCNIKNKKEYEGVILEDLNNPEKKIITKAFYWQMYEGYSCDIILCEIVKKNNDSEKTTIKQSIKNLKHPIFEINKEYKFLPLEIDICDINNEFIYLKGEDDGITHQLHKPFKLSEDSTYSYRYFGINNAGKLIFRQFVNFETIVKYRALKRLTYDKFREIKDNPILTKMFEDYDSFQNLWIISFCNFLEEEFSKNISQGELEESLIYIEVLIEFENWILNSGFINTFKNIGRESLVEVTKLKIEEFKHKKEALEIVLNNQQEKFLDDIFEKESYLNHLAIFNYLISYTSIFEENSYFLNLDKIINYIVNLGKLDFFKIKNDFQNNEKHQLSLLISKILGEYEKKIFENLFINSEKRDNFYTQNKDLENLSKLITLLTLIQKDLCKEEYFKLSLAKFYKYKALYSHNINEKINLLKISLQILFDKNQNINKEVYSWEKFSEIINSAYINNIIYSQPSINKIATLKDNLKAKKEIKGQLLGNNKYGYKVEILGNNSILPFKFFNDSRLNKILKSQNRILNCEINIIDEFIGNIYINPILKFDENLSKNKIEINSVVKGIVKSIEDYGVFFDLGEYDGLLHNSKLPFHSSILNVGEELELVIFEITEENEKKLISLTLYHELLKTNIIKLHEYDCFVLTKNNKYIKVITKEGFEGNIRVANLSYQQNFISYLNRHDKIKAKVINDKLSSIELNSNLTIKNPFKNNQNYLNKVFKSRVVEITPSLITLKFLDYNLIGYCLISNDFIELEKIELNDIVDFEIKEINSINKSILGIINYDNILKNDVKYVENNVDNLFYSEIASSYEHLAYSIDKPNLKSDYLHLAKIFYGFIQSPKSYYLDIIIRYEEIIGKMNIHKIELLNDNIIEVKLIANQIINFIEEQELTVKIFPNIDLIKQALKTLICYNTTEIQNYYFLINAISNNDLEIISKMSSLVLSTNSTPNELKTEYFIFDRWVILYNYLKEGLLKIESEDENEINKRNDLDAIIKKGENINNEFKASIFKPVHNETKRNLIENINYKLKLAEESDDIELTNHLKERLNEFNNHYSIQGVKHTAIKSLAAFANTEGGNLIIGLEDNSNVLGIEYETDTFDFDNNSKDKYLNNLDNLINLYIGNHFQNNIIFTEFIKIEGKNLLWIKVEKSKTPIFVKLDKEGKPKKEFYIRGRVSSPKLEIDEIHEYCKKRFSN